MEFLLVDDNEITLEIQKLMLESCGLSVVTADSGRSALELVKERSFFMIFMDINMPEMNGFQTSELIRRELTETPIIALSADEIAPDDPEFIKSGMNGSLLKPLQMTDLKELLSRFISIDTGKKAEEDPEDVIFGYEELLEVMTSQKAVLRILKQFLNVHSSDCHMLEEFIEQDDFMAAREILHNITGISGNMFCKKLYRISCSLNAELRQERSESLEEFIAVWNETCSALKEWRDKLSADTSVQEKHENWETIRDNFASLCDDFDVAAADLFAENINIFMENISPEKFQWLKDAVFNYDFLQISDNREALYV